MIEQVLLEPAPRLGSGVFGLDHDAETALVHLVPVPFEATVSYGGGTERGPKAIFDASAQVDLFDPDTGAPHRFGLFMHPIDRGVQALSRRARKDAEPIIACLGELGGKAGLARKLARVNAAGEAVNRWLEGEVERLLDAGKIVGVVGGDHSTPFGAIRALARRAPGLGILHVDAHADLRVAYEGFTWSHASIMHNVTSRIPEVAKLVQVGIRDFSDEELATIRGSGGRIETFFDQETRDRRALGETFRTIARDAVAALPEEVYVSFDIDGLDPALCPGTGTPVPGGLSFADACTLLLEVVRSGRRIVGFDLNEVAPQPGDREWNANVGARVLYKLIGATLLSRTAALSIPTPADEDEDEA